MVSGLRIGGFRMMLMDAFSFTGSKYGIIYTVSGLLVTGGFSKM